MSKFYSHKLGRARGGEILRGVKTWDALDQFALTDKIINIKFHRKDESHFCVRSDYEIALSESGAPYFIPIKQKPQIEVKYHQVSNATAISIDVRITNLHIVDSRTGHSIFFVDDTQTKATDKKSLDSTDAIFYSRGNPITRMEIQMGYRSQFPDWTQPPLSIDPPDGAEKTRRLKMFYDMDTFTVQSAEEEMDTGLRLDVKVLACYPEGLPPDNVIYVQGIVGTLDYGLKWQGRQDIDSLVAEYIKEGTGLPGAPTDTSGIRAASGDDDKVSVIEAALFVLVTKRFFRNNGTLTEKGNVSVLGYNAADKKFFSPEEISKRTKDQLWADGTIELENGFMSKDDALNLGVICSCSKAVREMSDALVVPTNTTVDQALTSVAKIPCYKLENRLGAQLNAIYAAHPDIRWYLMMDGNYFIYSVKEKAAQIIADMEKPRFLRQKAPILLPAIYDMSISGLRVIRCPFIGFISPMQKVGFRAKYQIGSLVGYFYPQPKDMWFMTILSEVHFDTTGDNNLMVLQCTTTDPPPGTPGSLADEDGEQGSEGKEDTHDEASKKTIRTIITWGKKRVVAHWVSSSHDAVATIPSSWENIVQRYIFDNDLVQAIQHEDIPKVSQFMEKDADGVARFNKNKAFAAGYDFLIDNSDENKNLITPRGKAVNQYGQVGSDPVAYAAGGGSAHPVSWLYVGDFVMVPLEQITEEIEEKKA